MSAEVTPAERDALAEVLRRHSWEYPESFCDCGAYMTHANWTGHYADAVIAADWAPQVTVNGEWLRTTLDAAVNEALGAAAAAVLDTDPSGEFTYREGYSDGLDHAARIVRDHKRQP